MGDTAILDQPWPPDLDPSDVQFRKRSVTVLARHGYLDDPTLFDTLTESEVLSWANAGPKTVTDVRTTGNAAIRRHHQETAEVPQLQAAMTPVAVKPGHHASGAGPPIRRVPPEG